MEIMTNKESLYLVNWEQIEESLPDLRPVSGGFSDASRGLLTLADGQEVFVKLGNSEATKGWASKEIRVYDFLGRHGFKHVPALRSARANQTAFALEVLRAEDGWDWTATWTKERLEATLVALDELAAISPPDADKELFAPAFSKVDYGWTQLATSEQLRDSLAEKVHEHPDTLVQALLSDVERYTEEYDSFVFWHDTLVHDDVRADNCAWNKETGEVKLIDWNWLELGDRRIDLSAFLVHVQRTGFDTTTDFSDRLNREALGWLAGFWLANASKPIWPGGDVSLRSMQLKSGLTALKMAEEM
jgi:hypothetical protein